MGNRGEVNPYKNSIYNDRLGVHQEYLTNPKICCAGCLFYKNYPLCLPESCSRVWKLVPKKNHQKTNLETLKFDTLTEGLGDMTRFVACGEVSFFSMSGRFFLCIVHVKGICLWKEPRV